MRNCRDAASTKTYNVCFFSICCVPYLFAPDTDRIDRLKRECCIRYLIQQAATQKMENEINATHTGKIKKINVSEGDSVEKEEILIEFE